MATVKIKVDYYDSQQANLIRQNFPHDFDKINSVAGNIIEVPIEDFKTYAFFRHQTDHNDFRTFTDIAKLSKNWGIYDSYFDFDSTTGKITNKYPGIIDNNDVPEIIGIGGGLSVAGQIYDLTQADWTKIGIQTHKDFDFTKNAVTSNRNVVLETKGSVIDNNQMRSEVSNHKSNILEKKGDTKFKQKYNYSQNTCLGIITAADKKNILQSWLVDPPTENISFDLRKIKLLKRLHYYYSIIRFLSKRTYFALVLANRIKTIELIADYNSLDGIPLLNANFEKIVIRDSFISSRATNKARSIVGRTLMFHTRELYYIGIKRDLLDIMIKQDFNEILDYKIKPFSTTQLIQGDILVRGDSYSKIFEKNNIKTLPSNYEDYFYFETELDIIQNSAGLNIARKILR